MSKICPNFAYILEELGWKYEGIENVSGEIRYSLSNDTTKAEGGFIRKIEIRISQTAKTARIMDGFGVVMLGIIEAEDLPSQFSDVWIDYDVAEDFRSLIRKIEIQLLDAGIPFVSHYFEYRKSADKEEMIARNNVLREKYGLPELEGSLYERVRLTRRAVPCFG